MNNEKSSKELIQDLYTLFSTFKNRMEDPNFIQIENSLTQLMENQQDMKKEIREMKKQLLNPFDGVIVETKKNTEEDLKQCLNHPKFAQNMQKLQFPHRK